MKENNSDATYCVFCESTEQLREFKTVYVCKDCIECAKGVKTAELLVE